MFFIVVCCVFNEFVRYFSAVLLSYLVVILFEACSSAGWQWCCSFTPRVALLQKCAVCCCCNSVCFGSFFSAPPCAGRLVQNLYVCMCVCMCCCVTVSVIAVIAPTMKTPLMLEHF